MSTTAVRKGKVAQVIGPVVDIEFFSEEMPAINNAITIDDQAKGIHLTAEVAGHLGDNTVRTVAMSLTQGLVRGMEAIDTGGPISVPVGHSSLGRVFDIRAVRALAGVSQAFRILRSCRQQAGSAQQPAPPQRTRMGRQPAGHPQRLLAVHHLHPASVRGTSGIRQRRDVRQSRSPQRARA